MKASHLPWHLAVNPHASQMAEVQPSSCVLTTWARNFKSQRYNGTNWTQLRALPYSALQSCSPFHFYPICPLTSSYSTSKFHSGLTLCLLTCYSFSAQNLHLTDTAVHWHCRRFAQINITFLHLPQGETMIKSRTTSWLSQPHHDLKLRKASFCICFQRGWEMFSVFSLEASEMIQKYCHTSSQSHYWCLCTFVILASFVVLTRAISCLHVVSLCFILLIENSLWVNAWRNESWMMCAFALVNLLQSLA